MSYVTVKQAAQHLGISEQRVRTLLRSGHLLGYRVALATSEFAGHIIADLRSLPQPEAAASAMLEAWRVVTTKREWMAGALCGPCWLMLMEEAYLRGELSVKDFYAKMHDLTACDWIGHPKGQIEPLKEVQADVLQIQHNLKSREETLLEHNRDWVTTFDQIEEEQDVKVKMGDPVVEEMLEKSSTGLVVGIVVAVVILVAAALLYIFL